MWSSFGWSTIRNFSVGPVLSIGLFQKVQREVIYFPYVVRKKWKVAVNFPKIIAQTVKIVKFLILIFLNTHKMYILTEIPIRVWNLFYTKSFIFVDVENAIHSDLVICNNFINCKLLPAFDFYFLVLESSQLHQTDITPERKCSNDYCFS